MRGRSAGGYLTALWAALLIAVLLSGEALILQAPLVDQPDSQSLTKQATDEKQPCRSIPDLTLAWVPIRTRGCVLLHANLRFFDAYRDDINALSTLLVAVFTFTLWRTTRGLIIAGEKQISIGRKSARTSLIAAKAAETQVANALRAELPIVVIQRTVFSADVILPANALPENGTIWIEIQNYGRTPAELLSHCFTAVVERRLPSEPVYYGDFEFPPGSFLVNSEPVKIPIMLRFKENDREDIVSGDKSVWSFGYVKFADFTGQLHEVRFCRMSLFRDDRPGKWFDFVVSGQTPIDYFRRT